MLQLAAALSRAGRGSSSTSVLTASILPAISSGIAAAHTQAAPAEASSSQDALQALRSKLAQGTR